MTFDQTILLIFSQICIETNLEFEIIKKVTKKHFKVRHPVWPMLSYLSNHYTLEFCIHFVLTIGHYSVLDLIFFGAMLSILLNLSITYEPNMTFWSGYSFNKQLELLSWIICYFCTSFYIELKLGIFNSIAKI